jgi:predicted  nucleic acid-binding Zn-ribbon protein
LNPNLSPLIELQKFDLRIMEIKDERRQIPQRLHIIEAPLQESKRVLLDATSAVDTLVKERRSHEKDLEAHEDRLEKLKERAAQLKTNQEYQAHLFEVELANKKKFEIEDKILICMEKIEQLQRVSTEAQEKVKTAEKCFAQEKQLLEERDQKLMQELAELEAQQRDRAAHIEKSLLDRYTKLKASRKDHALASVQGGICSGCRLQIPPQLIAEVKRSQDLHACPYCHRMLYWEGDVLTDQKPPQDQVKPSDLEVGESV